jgi:glycosyltransferase involved in cell wall biosynthesis
MNSAARAEITTVIPVYNGEKYLLETLQSLARQTRRPDRVIAVDDGSSDKTQEIVQNFRDLRCEWAPNAKNLGLFPNHNSAIRFAAETKFLHILHANDLVSPRFFEKLVPLIEKSDGYALAYCGHVFIREDGSETAQKGGIRGNVPRRLTLGEFLAGQSELQAIQLHSAVMKTDYRRLPVSFRTDLPQVGDVIFHAEFATYCSEIWADPEILCQVRIHADSASTKNLKNADAWVRDEWKAMQMVYDLMSKKNVAGALRKQKLKLLFAARSRVKMKMVAPIFPDYALEIAAIAKAHAGGLAWLAAGQVVALRDALVPKADAAHERITEPRTKK